MRQLFHCIQWYAGSERVKSLHTSLIKIVHPGYRPSNSMSSSTHSPKVSYPHISPLPSPCMKMTIPILLTHTICQVLTSSATFWIPRRLYKSSFHFEYPEGSTNPHFTLNTQKALQILISLWIPRRLLQILISLAIPQGHSIDPSHYHMFCPLQMYVPYDGNVCSVWW